jgi:two-component system response regulator HydG
LLRVLESRQLQAVGSSQAKAIDVRFVAATNDDLEARAADGRFRSDLFFRLAQYTIALPPLRERPEDVSHLAERFMREVSVELRRPMQGIAPDALGSSDARPAVPAAPRPPGQSLKDVADQAAREAERQAITEALKAAQGNKSEAARALKTDFKTLHVKMKNLGIRARDFEI